jgi:DNA-binding NarL/FixJ family response regulator
MIESSASRSTEGFRGLSPRELQVLAMTARGLTNRQIGSDLTLSVHAVKFHLAAIYRKLGASNRTEATFLYLNRTGDASLPEKGSTA